MAVSIKVGDVVTCHKYGWDHEPSGEVVFIRPVDGRVYVKFDDFPFPWKILPEEIIHVESK